MNISEATANISKRKLATNKNEYNAYLSQYSQNVEIMPVRETDRILNTMVTKY